MGVGLGVGHLFGALCSLRAQRPPGDPSPGHTTSASVGRSCYLSVVLFPIKASKILLSKQDPRRVGTEDWDHAGVFHLSCWRVEPGVRVRQARLALPTLCG